MQSGKIVTGARPESSSTSSQAKRACFRLVVATRDLPQVAASVGTREVVDASLVGVERSENPRSDVGVVLDGEGDVSLDIAS